MLLSDSQAFIKLIRRITFINYAESIKDSAYLHISFQALKD